MTETKNTVSCGKCNTSLSENTNLNSAVRNPCPKCGSTIRTFQLYINETVVAREKFGMKIRNSGGGKPFVEVVSGDDLHRNSGKLMKLERTIDRENDLYHEIVTNPSTGEIVHECKEPLSEHKGHGTAKFKNKDS